MQLACWMISEMADRPPTIYLDACPLIDMAERKDSTDQSDEAGACVWFCRQILRAARDGRVKVLTSFLSIAECTSIRAEDGSSIPSPPDEIKRFYEMLLLSGKSGLELVSLTQAITIKARNLRWVSGINLRGADTIHVASAMQSRCDELWTRDGKIWKKRQQIAELGLRVIKPTETGLLPPEYRALSLLPEQD
jgi:predicted nucleic acid-binding protein